MKIKPVWLWIFWFVIFAVWTYALVSPQPPKLSEQFIPLSRRYIAAKVLHFSAYAFLSFCIAWLPSKHRVMWTVLFLHAGITEWIQTYVPGRSGSLFDVALNCSGIFTGLLASLVFRSVRPAAAGQAAALAASPKANPTELSPPRSE